MNSADSSSDLVLDFLSSSERETDAFGAMLAAVIEPGVIVALSGPLGAGKTRFVRATATALGADPTAIHSPTFVLIQEYGGRIPVYHFDTYRLRDVAAFADLGVEEYFSGDGVCFVEWADRVTSVLPRDRLQIEVTVVGVAARQFRVTATGAVSQRLLRRWQQRLAETAAAGITDPRPTDASKRP
ncbi:MAG TPA: tRNA (adenosine(37)-N6)-threonylcarbamoyltransferase complex ATPase subunit type 1 TsaE [Planctomycetaceae bacterium]|nr:tRNA (adenosine(37)-N6)-threonylcarbamoyltransferase complex ATPase subunit type 1 TsaE [Planctomycetaceae bacterium]